jgi:hypothetical protein
MVTLTISNIVLTFLYNAARLTQKHRLEIYNFYISDLMAELSLK